MRQERIPKNMSKMRTHFLEEIQKNEEKARKGLYNSLLY